MVVALFPFEFHGLGYQVLANFVVDIGLVGLAELVTPFHTVHLAVFDEMSACLVEAERDAAGDTLLAEMSAAGGGTSRRPASTHLQEKAADLGMRYVPWQNV